MEEGEIMTQIMTSFKVTSGKQSLLVLWEGEGVRGKIKKMEKEENMGYKKRRRKGGKTKRKAEERIRGNIRRRVLK
jgi:hypothetical protein